MLRQGADVVSGRLGGAKLEETGVWSINGPGRSPTWWATFPVQREGEKRSPRVLHHPNVPTRHQLVTVRMHHEQGFAKKNLSKARFSTFQVLQSKDTYR
jgi:hypothetical protein